MENKRKLYRSTKDRMISGVCGGLAQHLEMDSTWVRVIFVLLALLSGIGILMYVLLAIIIPKEGQTDATPAQVAQEGAKELAQKAYTVGSEVAENVKKAGKQARHRGAFFIGLVLMILGAGFFLQNLNIDWPWWMEVDVWWPVILILVGALLFWKHFRGERT